MLQTKLSSHEGTIRATIDELLKSGAEVGIQVAAFKGETQVLNLAMGSVSPNGGGTVTPETLFCVYSVMKGVTSIAAHLLIDRGQLDFDAPIAMYWPEFAANGKARITMRDVLTHRAGIPQMPQGVTPERMCDWAWMTDRIAELEPIALEGGTAYLAMTFGWIVGETIRRADPTHRAIDRFVLEEVFKPLGISDIHYRLPEDAMPRLAVHSIVPDPLPPADSLNARALPEAVRLVPNVFTRSDVLRALIPATGGVANASSLARLYAMLANGGALDGARILSAACVGSLISPLTEQEEYEPVLMRKWRLSTSGFFLASSHKPAAGVGPGVLFSMGMGGTIVWADLEKNFSVAITHNRMLNARSADADPILRVAEAVRCELDLG